MGDRGPASAVILDLFGTLVDNFSFRAYEQVISEMAARLDVPRAEFALCWTRTIGDGWFAGAFPTVDAGLAHACSYLGIEPDPTRVGAAARAIVEFTQAALLPRDGAVEALTEVKRSGYTLGLISDCSRAVPLLWPDTPFTRLIDAPVFSCEAGFTKPDPRIYRLACERLGTIPERCVYVGDGGSDELKGASEAGMWAVLFRCDYADTYEPHRPHVDDWRGPAITCFADLLPLVQARQ